MENEKFFLGLDLDCPHLLVGVVWAKGVHLNPSSDDLRAEIEAKIIEIAPLAEYPPAPVKKAVRDVLRTAGYQPSGRGKPASEYLAAAAKAKEFPFINNIVDINNLISLESGLPISVLDLGRFTRQPVLRFGREGEKYIFNRAGQEIDLKGLMVVCDGDIPRGNPVKDSMETKLSPDSHEILGIIYGSDQALSKEEMGRNADRFADLLKKHAGAVEIRTEVLSG